MRVVGRLVVVQVLVLVVVACVPHEATSPDANIFMLMLLLPLLLLLLLLVHSLFIFLTISCLSLLRVADSKVVYRRYASLFFIAGCESTDNELITLEIVHRYVEQMDKYYGNVCELDIIFNFQKAYFILDELLLAGEMQESSKKNVLRCIGQQDSLEDMEVSSFIFFCFCFCPCSCHGSCCITSILAVLAPALVRPLISFLPLLRLKMMPSQRSCNIRAQMFKPMMHSALAGLGWAEPGRTGLHCTAFGHPVVHISLASPSRVVSYMMRLRT